LTFHPFYLSFLNSILSEFLQSVRH